MGSKTNLLFVINLHCDFAVLEQRILSRNEGRDDDKIEVLKNRFKVK